MPALIAGWFLLSLVVAAAFHFLRSRYRPVSIPLAAWQFLRRFEDEVRKGHPEVTIQGMVPGRFTAILAIRGQETPVALHHLFRKAVAFPETFPTLVSQFLDEVERDGLDRPADHALEDVAATILPQVRTRTWLAEHGPVFGDAALVHRSFTEDLIIAYVIDEPELMTFVCQAHLRRWGLHEEDLFHLASHNLHRLAASSLPVPTGQDQPVLVRTGDGFDATRVLLLDPERVEGLLVALPERDALWLGNAEDHELSTLMAQTEAQSQQAAHPLSPHLYRVRGGRLVPVTADSAR